MKRLYHTKTKKYKTQTKKYSMYECDCGNKKEIREDHVRSGRITSCGCKSKENAKKHGMTNSKEYKTWCGIKRRVLYKGNNPKLFYYRKVKMSRVWSRSFEAFFKDMGKAPSEKHEIDRINNNRGYFPSNCRWVTRSEQMKNRKKWGKHEKHN